MVGTLPVDVLSCPTLLMPGVSIRVKLHLNRPEFYIISSNDNCKAAFIMDTIVLNDQAVPSHPIECDFSGVHSTNATLFNNFTEGVTKHFNIISTSILLSTEANC